jgi:hypothetical protein
MSLDQWAKKHNIPAEAMAELNTIFGTDTYEPEGQYKNEVDEKTVGENARLYAAKLGWRLWRNNVGAYDEKNPPSPGSRWGVGNESAKVNKHIKSSDFIGIRPIKIGPEHVGTTIGQFVAIETKRPFWNYNPNNKREQAQLKFIELINSLGGHARFINYSGRIV